MAYLLSVGWTGIPIKEIDKINPWFYTQKGIILERNINETTKKYEDTNTSADWEDWRLYMVGQSHRKIRSLIQNSSFNVIRRLAFALYFLTSFAPQKGQLFILVDTLTTS